MGVIQTADGREKPPTLLALAISVRTQSSRKTLPFAMPMLTLVREARTRARSTEPNGIDAWRRCLKRSERNMAFRSVKCLALWAGTVRTLTSPKFCPSHCYTAQGAGINAEPGATCHGCFAAIVVARMIWRRYTPADGWAPGITMALFVSLAFAAGSTVLGEQWNWFVEGHRIGNNHMSYRADRLF
jgi:hypothetical protein